MIRSWATAVVCALAVSTAGVATTALAQSAAAVPARTATAAAASASFYDVPDPLPAAAPGTVIKTEPATAHGGVNGTVYRVMYHSRSVAGGDIPVTGLIAVPNGTPPAGGWPVVTWAHGTTGLADVCAPSKYDDFEGSDFLVNRGYEVVATDYEGLGTPGRHPYIVGVSEGRGVLDIVRAARNLPAAAASANVVIWGHSQGGHAALWANQIAPAYAPELNVVGTVAGAPPSQLQFIYAALRTSFFRYYLIMAAAGINAAYPSADPSIVLTPEALAKMGIVDTACGSDVGTPYAGMSIDQIVKVDPNSVEPWKSLIAAQEPGTVKSADPILIIQGGNDEQIPVVSTQLLEARMCGLGQVIQRRIYPGQTHAGVVGVADPDMARWIDNRFKGIEAPNDCHPETYLGNVSSALNAGPLTTTQINQLLAQMGSPASPATETPVLTGLANSRGNAERTVWLAYADILGRDADDAGWAYWTNQIVQGHRTIADVIAALAASPEFPTHLPPGPLVPGVDPLVNAWYQKLLGRSAGPNESHAWVSRYPGTALSQVPGQLVRTLEGRRHRADQLFQRYLKRSPSSATLDLFAARLRQVGEIGVTVDLLKSWEFVDNALPLRF